MPDLKSKTAAASHFVIRESVQNLRLLSKNLDDPSTVDRVLAESEIISASLKKLSKILEADAQENQTPAAPEQDPETEIGVSDVLFFLKMAETGRLCEKCGGFTPRIKE